MKLPLVMILLAVFGCASVDKTQTSEVSPKDIQNHAVNTNDSYKQMYFDYRAIVLEALDNNTDLNQLTDDYITESVSAISYIRVTKLNPDGEWDVLIDWRHPEMTTMLPKVHHKYFEKVHIIETREGFVMLQTGKTTNRNYPDNLYITMVIAPDGINTPNQRLEPTPDGAAHP